jgi:hypothetical protein
MTIYICNAFSLSMLDREAQAIGPDRRTPTPVTLEEAREIVKRATEEIVSAVGHTDTAKIFTEKLGYKIEPNRISFKLDIFDTALIGQYVGPRLPEGATTLPEGATIEWWLV